MLTNMEGTIRLIITIIVVIVLLVILIRFRSRDDSNKSSSLEVLKERRDRGEMTNEQYEEAKKQQKRR